QRPLPRQRLGRVLRFHLARERALAEDPVRLEGRSLGRRREGSELDLSGSAPTSAPTALLGLEDRSSGREELQLAQLALPFPFGPMAGVELHERSRGL